MCYQRCLRFFSLHHLAAQFRNLVFYDEVISISVRDKIIKHHGLIPLCGG